MIGWIKHLLPKGKPIYTMGLGRDPQNIVDIIKCGIDMFDCVAPTRLARNGALYHGELRGGNFESEFVNGRLNISNAQFVSDKNIILEGCDCFTCQSGQMREKMRNKKEG
ncbi:MAG: queuine tRNA-ribosyltransferase, queuine tRNA-ribosyltransferase [Microgenomates group bacterium GW2011_GWC1_44_37]|nr:MAG: queuine tRNA-ribosyltransferase, queuine tRNA-ribosyltransferase [Microgenomates group bacterium GW2011_GWC1_44_37]